MGRKHRKQNPFAAKKQQKRNGQNPRPDRRSEPYEAIKKENDAFVKFYEAQKFCGTAEDWQVFLDTIRKDLPSSFRITGFRDEAKALLEIIKTDFIADYAKSVAELHGIAEEDVEAPQPLPWYPDGMAYQLELTRKDIRRSEALYRLHNFLIYETNAGSISRQETVSMIPPLVLAVEPTDKVLDMCAAPGSKTAQLIEALHATPDKYRIPPGFVLANDVDNNRCYMLVHQAKRLNSPCFAVTNHDSCYFPDLLKTDEDGAKSILKFNKILCDVPCSGDGTLRKNPDIWRKWNLTQPYHLHNIQYRIIRRGAEMLEIGGRLVYSTCSLNPVENEAVIQRIITDAEGALEIVDVSNLVPGFKYIPGLTKWILGSKEAEEIYSNFEEVPEKFHSFIRPTMFPAEEQIKKIGLEKCMRVLPHFQNTGAFFVTVIEKRRKLPFEKEDVDVTLNKPKVELKLDENGKEIPEKSIPWGPQRKRRRMDGFKEDPYVFFNEDDQDYNDIREFFELDDSFKKKCLLTRCHADKKRNVYYCSELIRDLVLLNQDAIKIINTGVKSFVRCDTRNATHAFRLAQEGLLTTNAFMGSRRRIEIDRDDLILLLNCTDPTKPPSTTLLHENSQKRWKELGVGSCILKYVDARFTLFVVGWRGTSSLRAYVDTTETVHILRLIGADLSRFVVNKFQKAKEADVLNDSVDKEVELSDMNLNSNEKELSQDDIDSGEPPFSEDQPNKEVLVN